MTYEDVCNVCYSAPLMWKCLFSLCFNTGLRISDILKLNCSDFLKATAEYHNETDINKALLKLWYVDDIVPKWHNISNKTTNSHYTYNDPKTTFF